MISETREFKPRGPRNVCALALLAVAVSAVAVSAGAVSAAAPAIPAPRQPQIGVRTAPEITIDGLRFKDLNRNSRLDPYEDWRLPAEARADDLVSKMTPQEKAGAMQHGTAPHMP